MTRVCVIVLRDYYVKARVQRYVDALLDMGAQVDVLCPRGSTGGPANQRDGLKVFNIPLEHDNRSFGRLLVEYVAAFVLFTVYLLHLYVRNRYQVIQVHNMPDFLIFTALIPRLLGAKLILDICDPMPEFFMSKSQNHADGALVRLIRFQERFSSLFAHEIIVANSNFRKNMVTRGIPAQKITVVNNFSDTRIFDRTRYRQESSGRGKHFTLIYPGTIAPRYGIDIAVRAMPELVKRIPHLRLQIIGSQSAHAAYGTGLAALAQRLGVSPSVQFLPMIPVEDVARRMARADVGIYPALPDPHMRIATPTKVLEFASMGIPIVASRLPILEDLFDESAIMFFDPGSGDQFTNLILELFDDPALRSKLVKNMDSTVNRTHKWEKEREAYYAVLARLLSAR